jgi:hypothetical protein
VSGTICHLCLGPLKETFSPLQVNDPEEVLTAPACKPTETLIRQTPSKDQPAVLQPDQFCETPALASVGDAPVVASGNAESGEAA